MIDRMQQVVSRGPLIICITGCFQAHAASKKTMINSSGIFSMTTGWHALDSSDGVSCPVLFRSVPFCSVLFLSRSQMDITGGDSPTQDHLAEAQRVGEAQGTAVIFYVGICWCALGRASCVFFRPLIPGNSVLPNRIFLLHGSRYTTRVGRCEQRRVRT